MIHNSIIGLKSLSLLFMLSMAMASCLKDPAVTPPANDPARVRVEMTDAPIDDANVKGVFITVVDVKVDGKSWTGFAGKVTFDLLSFQKGQTKLLGEGELDAGAYSEIVLVLDTETDANGDSPGCYVKDVQDVKRKLEGSSQFVLKAKGSFSAVEAETTEAIIDMDLRKSIVYKPGSTTDFQFVTDPELTTSIRLMDKAKTGTVSGDCTDGVSNSSKIIVYAYKKGEFNVNEKFPQGASQVEFKNAITSSVVASDGTFNLSFLETGTYEIHFISYQLDAQGKLQAKGELVTSLLNSTLNLLALNVTANANISMELSVTGILFF